jgi:hypothetical protein
MQATAAIPKPYRYAGLASSALIYRGPRPGRNYTCCILPKFVNNPSGV